MFDLKLVADAPNGLYIKADGLVEIEFRADTFDMRVHGSCISEIFVAPNIFEKMISRIHFAGVGGKEPKDLDLFLRQNNVKMLLYLHLAQ